MGKLKGALGCWPRSWVGIGVDTKVRIYKSVILTYSVGTKCEAIKTRQQTEESAESVIVNT